MASYLAIQNTYDIFEIALFIDDTYVDHVQEDKRHTSKLFVVLVDQLLARNNAEIDNLDFCAVNCGPGPFSTLRSIIASVNGLHAATNIPLIGIDGLQATFLEFYDKNYENTVVLLNAFNHEVYYLIAHQDQILAKGYKKIDLLLDELLTKFSNCARSEPVEEYLRALEETLQPAFAKASAGAVRHSFSDGGQVQGERGTKDIKQNSLQQPIHFFGNGVTLYQDLIKQTLGNNAIIKELNPSMCSVEMIGKLGLEKWRSNHKDGLSAIALATAGYLMPLHLKKHAVEL